MANVTKDPDWLTRLNKNDVDNSVTDTGWSLAGVVYVNGFSAGVGDPMEYRIVKFGTSKLVHVYITGVFGIDSKTGAIKAGTKNIMAKLPKTVYQYQDGTIGKIKGYLGREFLTNNGSAMELSLSNTGELSIISRTDIAINNTFFVDTQFIVNLV